MRTTLTLDPDLEPRVQSLRKARGVSMARVVNELIRAGLAAPKKRPARYRSKLTWRAESRVGSLDNIGEVLALGEGEGRK
jgi:hypothetical protein